MCLDAQKFLNEEWIFTEILPIWHNFSEFRGGGRDNIYSIYLILYFLCLCL